MLMFWTTYILYLFYTWKEDRAERKRAGAGVPGLSQVLWDAAQNYKGKGED